jgi:hypothetical protein
MKKYKLKVAQKNFVTSLLVEISITPKLPKENILK